MRSLTPAAAAVALLLAQVAPGFAQTAAPTTPPATAPATTPPAATPPAAPPPAAAAPGTSVPEATAPAAPAPTTAAPSATTPQTTAPTPKPRKPRAHGKRMSMHQRFTAANTAQDGHLTLDQAQAAHWTYATRNFGAIDKDHKGYITEADIHAYSHARYLARHAQQAAPAAPPAPAAPAPAAPPPAPAAPAAPAPAQ